MVIIQNPLNAGINGLIKGIPDGGYQPRKVYLTVPRSQRQWLKNMLKSWELPGDFTQGS